MRLFSRFLSDQGGASSVEWIVVMGSATIIAMMLTYDVIGDGSGDNGVVALVTSREAVIEDTANGMNGLLGKVNAFVNQEGAQQ